MKIKDMKPADYNPRKISDKKLGMLDKAMREFGDLSGVVFNRKTGNLIGGHQRVKNLDPEWAVIKKPFKDDLGTVAQGHIETPFGQWVYREVEWDIDKEKVANLAANNAAGSFDVSLVDSLLEDIDESIFDVELTGFDEADLLSISKDVKKAELSEDSEDDINQDGPVCVKMVISVDDIKTIESAFRATKLKNRGDAFLRICKGYIGEKERQLDGPLEDLIAEQPFE